MQEFPRAIQRSSYGCSFTVFSSACFPDYYQLV